MAFNAAIISAIAAEGRRRQLARRRREPHLAASFKQSLREQMMQGEPKVIHTTSKP